MHTDKPVLMLPLDSIVIVSMVSLRSGSVLEKVCRRMMGEMVRDSSRLNGLVASRLATC